MRFRKALAKDHEAIHALLQASFSMIYAYYAEKSFALLTNTLAATDKSGLTGIINWRNFRVGGEKICYLYWLAVRPDRRKLGLGKKLFQRAIAKGKGCTMICAATEKRNKIAQKLIQHEGFTLIDRKGLKARFGAETSRLTNMMNLMPWEDLYIRH